MFPIRFCFFFPPRPDSRLEDVELEVCVCVFLCVCVCVFVCVIPTLTCDALKPPFSFDDGFLAGFGIIILTQSILILYPHATPLLDNIKGPIVGPDIESWQPERFFSKNGI